MKPSHPYRKGPRLDSYEPNKPTHSAIRMKGGKQLVPPGFFRCTKEERAAYGAVWAEYEATGKWTPKSQSGVGLVQ